LVKEISRDLSLPWKGREGSLRYKIKMAKVIPYNPNLKALARKLRKDMTFEEVLFWNKLWGFDF
jgi:hypothetical protein